MRVILLFILFGLSISISQSQDKQELYLIAEDIFYEENFELALEAYNLIANEKEIYADVQYKLEICSLLVFNNYNDLSKLYSYESEMMPPGKEPVDKFYYYWVARVLLVNNKFEEALAYLETFLELDVYKSEMITEETNKWIEYAKVAQEYYHSSVFYLIDHLNTDINSKFNETSPVILQEINGLIFLSNKKDNNDIYTIYLSTQLGPNKWSIPVEVSNLGAFKSEFPTIELSTENKRLFQYRNGLYVSEALEEKNSWSVPKKFDESLDKLAIDAHYFINSDESRLFFVKNRGSNRFPNYDIYVVKKESNKWSTPKPLPKNINSSFNEDSPFLSADGKTLYFSSNNLNSIGGYDIFKSEYNADNDSWSDPENMGFPINTLADEKQLKFNHDQTFGFFTSDRVNTYGEKDIYYFKIAEKVKLEGQIVDSLNNPLEARIYLRNRDYMDIYYNTKSDKQGYYSLELPSDGRYDVEFKLADTIFYQQFDYLTKVKSFSQDFTLNLSPKLPAQTNTLFSNSKNLELKQIKKEPIKEAIGQNQGEGLNEMKISELGSKYAKTNKVVMRNLYYDPDSFELNETKIESLRILKKLLMENKSMRIEISGHTDDTGSFIGNLKLSKKRADFVKKWLIKQGISEDRLESVGFGEKQPIASNDDEMEGRELNRRIEVKILK